MPFAFFGLCLEPEKTYSQSVSKSFRVSMASFGENVDSKSVRSCVKVEVDGEEFVLCSLSPGSNEQQTLDVIFETGEDITLSVTGKNSVYLTGNYLPEEDHDHDHDDDDDDDMESDSAENESADSDENEDEDSDEEEVSEEDLKRLRALVASHADEDDEDDSEEDPDFSGSDMDDGEEDEEDSEEIDDEEELDEEMEDVEPVEVGQKRKAEKASSAADKKMKDNTSVAVNVKASQPAKTEKKAETKEKKAATTNPETTAAEAQPSPAKPLSKKERKAAAAKARAEQEAEAAKAKPAAPAEKSPAKKVLGNGLQIEDVKIGTGARAKKGKKVGVRYIGKLASNGKVFDKNVSGKPFVFLLGRGEVIKGWDLGVEGMNVGGERRLVIPAVLAYGARGAPPDIPKNATLEFEVKLLTVN